MAMVKLPNAPSIPSHNNVFGYEETASSSVYSVDGELVQQQNPEKIFAGEGDDAIGPGHYEIGRSPFGRHKGTNWHASNARRGNAQRRTNNYVGPGTYDTDTSTIGYKGGRSAYSWRKGIRKNLVSNGANLMESVQESELDSNVHEVLVYIT